MENSAGVPEDLACSFEGLPALRAAKFLKNGGPIIGKNLVGGYIFSAIQIFYHTFPGFFPDPPPWSRLQIHLCSDFVAKKNTLLDHLGSGEVGIRKNVFSC